jgi:hypothetical protein
MNHPLFAQIHQHFVDIANAMNNFELLEKGGTINWKLVRNVDDVGKGPLDVVNRMRTCRDYLAELPDHGKVNLEDFDRMIARWDQAAQVDNLPETFSEDRRWVMRYGQI